HRAGILKVFVPGADSSDKPDGRHLSGWPRHATVESSAAGMCSTEGREMIKVGIVGGTGYTGVELLRLLAQHPQVEVTVITSRSEAGVKVVDMYPNLRGHYDNLAFSVPDSATLGACDAVFFATP